jgi:hypothetical protein
MEEQFIQDAISNLARLQRIINRLGYPDWQALDTDLLNQEFNFSAKDANGARFGGRIDVLATFNGRTRLAIIEAKMTASKSDLKQMCWYTSNCHELVKADDVGPAAVDFCQTIGILLAREFVPGDYETDNPRIHFVRIRFDGKKFPFEVPAIIPPCPAEDTPSVFKHSRLNSLPQHRDWLRSDLHAAFDELRRLCLRPHDRRATWIVENVKGGHIAIHYKGNSVMWFFVWRNWFDVGYILPKGQSVKERVSIAEQTRVLEQARAHLPLLLESIDAQDELRGIPSNFDWNDCDNG